jgi:hypothetical protein
VTLSADDIYALLPAIHRTRDAEHGSPLRALIGVIAEQVDVLDQDLRDFYANQFIETCAEWVVPYIGDLIGWRGLYTGIPGVAGSRAEVANTIGYRRRKGTLIALEQIAHDVTGRPARAVEYFRRLVTNQSLHHLRPDNLACADLRDGAALGLIGCAFDTLNRSADVRRIAPRDRAAPAPDTDPLALALHGGGRFNIPDIGVHLWRWRSRRVTAQPAIAVDERRFLCSPLGAPLRLFNAPPPRASFAGLTTRRDVPQPIGRREFHDNPAAFYGAAESVLVSIDGKAVPLSEICVCALDDWGGGWAPAPAGKVAIDPLLGRIAVGADLPAPMRLSINYHYGFPFDIGGGPYDRSGELTLPRPFTWQALVGEDVPTLAAAVAGFNAQAPGVTGAIVVPDFEILAAGLAGANAIMLPAGSQLWILAAHPLPDGGWILSEARPTLLGDIAVLGTGGAAQASQPGSLMLSGLLIGGTLSLSGAAVEATLQDCTLAPGRGLTREGRAQDPGAWSIAVETAGSALRLDRCITGPVLTHAGATLRITNTIVDASSRWDVALAGPDGAGEGGVLHIEDSTVIGKVRTHLIELASNTIFLAARARHDPWQAAIWSTQRQAGCIRFCFAPLDAITPAQYRCLPGDASEGTTEPKFVALRYGDPSYGLLSCDCPIAVWRGADDESQIGAYHALYETQGVTNLQTRLGEYLPFGLEAGIFLIPCQTEPEAASRDYDAPATHRIRADDDDLPHGVAIGGMLI